ncbi:MAG TPA: hypothetical protein VF581_03285 [Flavobacterium sp.]
MHAFFIPTLLFSQDTPRQILRGQVVADSLDVEKVNVLNNSTNISAGTDAYGKFTIYARAKDTLIFSSVILRPLILILREDDFTPEGLKVRLEGGITMLDEVIVSRMNLTGQLDTDSKSIKTFDLKLPTPANIPNSLGYVKGIHNIATPATESSLTGINFVKIGRFLAGIFVKPNPKQPGLLYEGELFADEIKARFTYHFFTETLRLAPDKMGLFLAFCDTAEAKQLLADENMFELTDYLIKKSEEFHKVE